MPTGVLGCIAHISLGTLPLFVSFVFFVMNLLIFTDSFLNQISFCTNVDLTHQSSNGAPSPLRGKEIEPVGTILSLAHFSQNL
jgi:hypothetical protein